MRWCCVLWLGLLVAACGGDGSVGDPCDVSGDLDECEEGAICTENGDDPTCRYLCEDHGDCESDERCNGVSGSNRKSCQPEDGDGGSGGTPI